MIEKQIIKTRIQVKFWWNKGRHDSSSKLLFNLVLIFSPWLSIPLRHVSETPLIIIKIGIEILKGKNKLPQMSVYKTLLVSL